MGPDVPAIIFNNDITKPQQKELHLLSILNCSLDFSENA